jgi:hypothetical protein
MIVEYLNLTKTNLMNTLKILLGCFIALLLFPHAQFSQSLELEWAKGFEGLVGNFETWESTVDNEGDLYVIAKFHLPNTLMILPENQIIVIEDDPNWSESDIVLKFSSSGSLIWYRIFHSTVSDNRLWSIDSDSNGNLYLGGEFRYTVDFDPGPDEYMVEVLPGPDCCPHHNFLIKLNSEGEFQWVIDQGISPFFSFSMAGNGNSINVDSNEEIITVGSFGWSEWDFDPGPDSLFFEPYGEMADAVIVKYSENGDLIWAKQLFTEGQAHLGEVKSDSENNMLVSGYSSDTLYYPDNSGDTISIDHGVFLLKMDHEGDYLWHRNFGDLLFYHDPLFAAFVELDSESNTFVFGTFTGDLHLDNDSIDHSDGLDLFLMKLDEQGELVWNKRLGVEIDSTTTGFVAAQDIAMNSFHEIFVTALNTDTDHVNIFGSNISMELPKSLFAIQFSENGELIALKEFRHEPYDIVNNSKINFTTEGDPIISGHVEGGLQFDVGIDTLMLEGNFSKGFLLKLNRIPNSISEYNQDLGVSLYPNPSSNHLFIENPNYLQLHMELLGSSGRLLQQRNANSSRIIFNLNEYSSGMYFLSVGDENAQQIFKIQKL